MFRTGMNFVDFILESPREADRTIGAGERLLSQRGCVQYHIVQRVKMRNSRINLAHQWHLDCGADRDATGVLGRG